MVKTVDKPKVTKSKVVKAKVTKSKVVKQKNVAREAISSGAVKRLCILAKVNRISKDASTEVKKIIKAKMSEVLLKCAALADYEKVKTIKHKHLMFLVHGKISKEKDDIKLCKNSEMLRKMSKSEKCIVISRKGFLRHIKSILGDKYRVSGVFALHFQHFIESEIVKMLRAAHDATVDVAGRKTLEAKDIKYVNDHNCVYKGAISIEVLEQFKKAKKAKKTSKKTSKKPTKKTTKKVVKSPVF